MSEEAPSPSDRNRRGFMQVATNSAMAGGLLAGYGTFAGVAGRFLYPASEAPTAWQFVAAVGDIAMGQSLDFVTPSGAGVVIARHGEGDTADQFIALSSICPHLGCQVHWEAVNDRFFCPCHNGAFDRQGNATEGPPAKANQQLKLFPLKVEAGLLYIQVATESLSANERNEA